MPVHIGEVIHQRIKEKRLSVVDFAEFMSMSYRNAMALFKRSVINTDQLIQASEFLNEDLTVYLKRKAIPATEVSEPKAEYGVDDDLKMYVVLKGSYDNMPKFRDMIKEVNDVTAKYGFSMMT